MKRVLVSVVVMVMLFLAGCGDSNDVNTTPQPTMNINEPMPTPVGELKVKPVSGGTVTLGVSKFRTLNPLVADNEDMKHYLNLVYDPLFKLDFQQNVLPCLAVSAKTQDKGMSWEISLRKDVVWHDDKAFSAADCIHTINFLMKNDSLYSANVANIEECTLIDEYTFSIKLRKPDMYVAGKLTFPIISATATGIDKNAVGTSMYRHIITEDNKMVLVANDKYWGKMPYIETVEIHFFDNERLKYESNCDLLLLTGSNVTRYMNKAGYISYKYTGRNYVCLVPNLRTNNVAMDVNIRKALMHIIDFERVINASVSGNGIKAAWPVMPGTRYTKESSHMYERDLNKAVEYLERAGYRKLDDGYWYKASDTQRRYPLTIPVNVLSVDTEMRLCAENIKKQVEEIGIIFSINYQTEADFETALTSNNFSCALLSFYIGSWPDIEPLFATEGVMNLSGYTNEELDGLLAGLFEKDSILDDMTRIKGILDDDLPIMGLYISQEAIVISEKIYGKDAEYNFWSLLDNFGNLHMFTEGIIEE